MKKIFIGLTALLVSLTLYAGQRTAEEAAAIAAQFTNQQPQLRCMHKAPRAAANMRLAHTALQNDSQNAAFYVFNQENENGFIIVSADDRTAQDVLVYSDKGAFNIETINPNFKWWLERFAEEITVLQTIDDSEFIEPAVRKATQVTAIKPLLKNKNGKEITWYQETPYNNLCPIDQRDKSRSLTGCVATAASQIMYKWRWPEKGTGKHKYTWYNCMDDWCNDYKTSTLEVDFSKTSYDWDNMLPAYEGKSYSTKQATAVATLMYHVGVSCDMWYGGDANNGSGAWTDDMAYALKTYFNYKIGKFISQYSKSDYESENVKGQSVANVPYEFEVTTDQIVAYFNADLEAGRPIMMGGESTQYGHEFVCDGRDTENNFHINWGWEDNSNCYTAITSLKPDGKTTKFNKHIDALIGLEPNGTPAAIESIATNEAKSGKVIENGQLIIIRNNEKYSVFGQKIQ